MNVVITVLLLIAMSVFIVYSIIDIVKKIKCFKKSKNSDLVEDLENEKESTEK